MKLGTKKICAFFMASILIITLVQNRGNAVTENIYFSAANDQLLELEKDSMPFWNNNELYISKDFFVNTTLGIRYTTIDNGKTAVLYITGKDLRFDCEQLIIYDQTHKSYSAKFFIKNNTVFFPINLVCHYFGLTWNLIETSVVPLIRIKDNTAVLTDQQFVEAASGMMSGRYYSFKKNLEDSKKPDDVVPLPPPSAHNQTLYMILASYSADSTREMLDFLGDDCYATFLLTAEQMSEGDLLRRLIGTGHSVALYTQGKTPDAVQEEIVLAQKQLWNATCSLLQYIWYKGEADISQLLNDFGCINVSANLDSSKKPLNSKKKALAFFELITTQNGDVTMYLGYDKDCLDGISYLLPELQRAEFHFSAWKMTTGQ